MKTRVMKDIFLIFLFILLTSNYLPDFKIKKEISTINLDKLELTIRDLKNDFSEIYDVKDEYLKKLALLKKRKNEILFQNASEKQIDDLNNDFEAFKKEVLFNNPLLSFDTLIVVKRRSGRKTGQNMISSGFASNHENHTSLPKTGWDNEIAVLSPVKPEGNLNTFFRPPDKGYVGEVDLHWNADKLMFTVSNHQNWKLIEMNIDQKKIHEISPAISEIDFFDGCYLPNGKIIFNTNAMNQSVPCWHGQKHSCNLYKASASGTEMRQICFDQDHNWHPTVMNNGQVMYVRWDYTGTAHAFLHHLFVMNPDGTGQRSLYGTNTYWPNSTFYPKPIPGSNHKIIAVITGYHDYPKSGFLVIFDLSKGYRGLDGITARISGNGDTLQNILADKAIQGTWPIFTTPYPLSDKYFLVSKLDGIQDDWTICLVDIFDNVIELKSEKGYDLLEPIPLLKQKTPPVISEKISYKDSLGIVYLQNVYTGPGLEGIPYGTVKKLRIFSWNYGYVGLAGPDKIGYGGPWDATYLLGTTPVYEDGSAIFKVPANMPIAIQPIDEEGRALQLMRNWFTVMPGEIRSCIGCHEDPRMVPHVGNSIASKVRPNSIDEWYGPMRGFDFEREVQPVLDHYCVTCHDGNNASIPDLRAEKYFPDYEGKKLAPLAQRRIHEKMKYLNGKIKYTPAYDELLKYIRRDGIEADVEILTPGPLYTTTSELVQMLKKGHHGIHLNKEAWERIYTWIDLNAPCHGTWGDVHEIPDDAYSKRKKNALVYGNQKIDPEKIREPDPVTFPDKYISPVPPKADITIEDWPLTSELAKTTQNQLGMIEKILELGPGITLELIKIPKGKFIMGDNDGKEDERPLTPVHITKPFWISKYEITNELYNLFDSEHNSKYYNKRRERENDEDKGASLNGPKQPVVNISWQEAIAFCKWLSAESNLDFILPTEAQWEYACRAGSNTSLNYGAIGDDFSNFANMADLSFSNVKQLEKGLKVSDFQVTGGLTHLWLEGAALSDKRFNDNGHVTVAVGKYQPNEWGLYDMHGNAAEWTLSSYLPYPFKEEERNRNKELKNEKVVRGGSFYDRPVNCRAAGRLSYPEWMKIFNVGFRVVCEIED